MAKLMTIIVNKYEDREKLLSNLEVRNVLYKSLDIKVDTEKTLEKNTAALQINEVISADGKLEIKEQIVDIKDQGLEDFRSTVNAIIEARNNIVSNV